MALNKERQDRSRSSLHLLLGFAGLLAANAWAAGAQAAPAETPPLAASIGESLLVGQEDAGSLLFVGPAIVDSNEEGTWVSVLGQLAGIDLETSFPRGLVSPGDYVAVTGELSADGPALATSIIRLGGSYSAGNSPVYLRGMVSGLNSNGTAAINAAEVDLAQAYAGDGMASLANGDMVEVLGFELPGAANDPIYVIATNAANLADLSSHGVLGIHGSGVRGIHGSGVRNSEDSSVLGIHGSGVRGIHGSGVRGIHGSGVRNSEDSSVLGIHGSGVRGIHGSGVRTSEDSSVLGIHGSGVRGIHGSGIR